MLWEGELRSVERFATVGIKTVLVTELAGQHAGSAWPTNRIGAKRVGENRTLFGDSIDVGCCVDLRAVGTDRLAGVIVCENKDDIRSVGGRH